MKPQWPGTNAPYSTYCRHADLATEKADFERKKEAIWEKESADLERVQQQLANSAASLPSAHR